MPPKKRGNWAAAEDAAITAAVERFRVEHPHRKTVDWAAVARAVPGRSAGGVQGRWVRHISDEFLRGPWTPEEDEQLLKVYHEQPSWTTRATALSTVPGKRRGGADVCARYFHLVKARGLDPPAQEGDASTGEDAGSADDAREEAKGKRAKRTSRDASPSAPISPKRTRRTRSTSRQTKNEAE